MTVERYEGLEATTENIKRLIGEEGARLLSDTFGGRRLYVPTAPGAHHPISVAIGEERAAQLAAAFHSVFIDIPMQPAAQAEIVRLDAEGRSRSQIARLVGCTERWVYKALETAKTSRPRDPDLFDRAS